MEREFVVGRCKLFHLEWISNKFLLYSTGNYIQYSVTNHNGKEYIYIYIYTHTYIKRSHFAVQKKLTTLCINYIPIKFKNNTSIAT